MIIFVFANKETYENKINRQQLFSNYGALETTDDADEVKKVMLHAMKVLCLQSL